MKKLVIVLLLSAIAAIAFYPPAIAADMANGAKIFSVQCAGCHANGGNIIRRGKTLQQRALKRNKMDTIEAIADLVAQGKNPMPGYSDRLSAKEINDVAVYVLEKAETGWK